MLKLILDTNIIISKNNLQKNSLENREHLLNNKILNDSTNFPFLYITPTIKWEIERQIKDFEALVQKQNYQNEIKEIVLNKIKKTKSIISDLNIIESEGDYNDFWREIILESKNPNKAKDHFIYKEINSINSKSEIFLVTYNDKDFKEFLDDESLVDPVRASNMLSIQKNKKLNIIDKIKEEFMTLLNEKENEESGLEYIISRAHMRIHSLSTEVEEIEFDVSQYGKNNKLYIPFSEYGTFEIIANIKIRCIGQNIFPVNKHELGSINYEQSINFKL